MSKKWVLKDYVVRAFLELILCAPFMFYLNGIFLIILKVVNFIHLHVTNILQRNTADLTFVFDHVNPNLDIRIINVCDLV